MISVEDYEQWSTVVPWDYPPHVEQDLILARLMVNVAHHEALRGKLAFKGGTAVEGLKDWKPETTLRPPRHRGNQPNAPQIKSENRKTKNGPRNALASSGLLSVNLMLHIRT